MYRTMMSLPLKDMLVTTAACRDNPSQLLLNRGLHTEQNAHHRTRAASAWTPAFRIFRKRRAMLKLRQALGAAAMLLGMGAGIPGVTANEEPIKIITLGDAVLHGRNLPDATDYLPGKLGAALAAEGFEVQVEAVGIRETSESGLIWLTKTRVGRALLDYPFKKAVILALGRNDCGRFPLWMTEAYLEQTLELLAARRIPILLVGTQAFEYCGSEYVAAYTRIFPELAEKYGILLYMDVEAAPSIEVTGVQRFNAFRPVALEALLPSVRKLLTSADYQE